MFKLISIRTQLKKTILKNELAEVFLAKAYLNKCFFDLIDLDCFGSPNSLLQPVLKVLAFDGILILSSTDARSTTGHDRKGAIRSLCAAVRTHSASWEIGLRLQLAAVARQAWLLGRGIEPIACFSDGRTFRIFIRLKKGLVDQEEKKIGFIVRCEVCGAQTSQPLIQLKNWEKCSCDYGFGNFSINGPLWLGRLQSSEDLVRIRKLSQELSLPIISKSEILINRLIADIGLPLFSWSANELAKRIRLASPPSLELIINYLTAEGYTALRNGLVPGHFRTNAPIKDLLRICEEKLVQGFK